jgi:hypothetical protein
VFPAQLYQTAVGNRVEIPFTFVMESAIIFEGNASFCAVPSAPERALRFSYRPVKSFGSETNIGQTQQQQRSQQYNTTRKRHDEPL